MIKKNMYESLKNNFGFTASWAIWAAPENGDWRSKCSVSDMSVFRDEGKVLSALNDSYIFVGLNPAAHEDAPHSKVEWEAFHSSDASRSQDYKLRYALKDTEYWGSFMTDIYTGIVETNADAAMKDVTSDTTNKSIDTLLKIRKMLGDKAMIVAMGTKAYGILKKALPRDVELKMITHYSFFINQDEYREKVLKQLK